MTSKELSETEIRNLSDLLFRAVILNQIEIAKEQKLFITIEKRDDDKLVVVMLCNDHYVASRPIIITIPSQIFPLRIKPPVGRLDVFDIVSYLATIGLAQANNTCIMS